MKSGNDKVFRILFVCEGNTCRSPMAAAALKTMVPKTLANKVVIASAGLNALPGAAASVEAELAARRMGYDMSGHRANPVDEVLLEQSDLILCMEPRQTDYLRERMPLLAGRIHTLQAFCSGKNEPVDDPWRKDLQTYFGTMEQIDALLKRCKKKIWARVLSKG